MKTAIFNADSTYYHAVLEMPATTNFHCPYDVVTQLPEALRWAAMHLDGVGSEEDIATETAKITVRGVHTVVLTPEQAARARFA